MLHCIHKQQNKGNEMETFKSLVDAVKENNRINNAKWTDWDNAKHIQESYGELQNENKNVAESFLNALIRDNGKNIVTYLETMDCLEYGYSFDRSNYGE